MNIFLPSVFTVLLTLQPAATLAGSVRFSPSLSVSTSAILLLGRCSARGARCICTREYRPVCGSNMQEYSNRCMASCAGQEDATDGPCETPSPILAKSSDSVPEIQKRNQPMPCVCTRIWRPVCGYDRITYGNECEAACAGQEDTTEGPCSEPVVRSASDYTGRQGIDGPMTYSVEIDTCSQSKYDQEVGVGDKVRVEFISNGEVVGTDTKYGAPECVQNQAAVWKTSLSTSTGAENVPDAIAIRTNSRNEFYFDHFSFRGNGLVLKRIEADENISGWCVSKEAWHFRRGYLRKTDGNDKCYDGIIISLSDGSWQPSQGIN